jgi:hypothetical protein
MLLDHSLPVHKVAEHGTAAQRRRAAHRSDLGAAAIVRPLPSARARAAVPRLLPGLDRSRWIHC